MADIDHFPVPLELHDEEKIFGGYLSIRQVAYLLMGSAVGYLGGHLGYSVLRLFIPPVVAGVMMGLTGLVPLGIAALLAFAPAGLGILPGPQYRWTSNPYDPPPRLDQWLVVLWRYRRKTKTLPYRVLPPVGARVVSRRQAEQRARQTVRGMDQKGAGRR